MTARDAFPALFEDADVVRRTEGPRGRHADANAAERSSLAFSGGVDVVKLADPHLDPRILKRASTPRRPLRVGIVAENYFPSLGGIQEHVRNLRNYLRGHDVSVTILTGVQPPAGSDSVPLDAEVDVVRVGKARRYGVGGTYTQATAGLLTAWRFLKALRKGRFDVLNIHGPCDIGLAFLALTLFRGPKVFTLHSCFPDSRWRHWIAPYYRWAFRRADRVIAVSEATAAAMRRYAVFDATIIPNGVDNRYWHSAAVKRLPAAETQPGRSLVFLGRLEHRNGPDLAIDAFSEIADSVPDLRLVMVGDGPLRPELEARVPPHLRERVAFVGAVYNQRATILASASLFLLPARAVGFSIMVLEAFAAGIPVVSRPALGTAQAGDHWSNVIMAADATAQSFGRAIVQALEEDQGQRIGRGRAIAATYDWSYIGPRILEVLSGAAAEAAPARDRIIAARAYGTVE